MHANLSTFLYNFILPVAVHKFMFHPVPQSAQRVIDGRLISVNLWGISKVTEQNRKFSW